MAHRAGSRQHEPKVFQSFSDAGIIEVINLMVAIENADTLPRQLVLIIVFLAKPSGGTRPIGLIIGSMRLWAKVRRPLADEWERAHSRPYFFAAKGKSAEHAAWQIQFLHEWSAAIGLPAASLLKDLRKAYERVGHNPLLRRGARITR